MLPEEEQAYLIKFEGTQLIKAHQDACARLLIWAAEIQAGAEVDIDAAINNIDETPIFQSTVYVYEPLSRDVIKAIDPRTFTIYTNITCLETLLVAEPRDYEKFDELSIIFDNKPKSVETLIDLCKSGVIAGEEPCSIDLSELRGALML